MIAIAETPATQDVAVRADTIPTAARDNVIERLLDAIALEYVFPEKVPEMRTALSARRAAGGYAGLTDAELATALTRDLQAVTHDKHLSVRFMRDLPPPPIATPGMGEADCFVSAGICAARILEGNVGYIEVRSFGFPAPTVADYLAAAMTAVSTCDALVIDIRRNGGGSPDVVRLIASYLFGEQPILLNTLYWRSENRTDEFYTLPTVAGKRFGAQKPVYVLTSSRTFSAAEEFAYDLQSQKRAVIVGETSGGGAHPGGVERITSSFSAFIPRGRAINPITKTNWEGTGVRPDIAASADSALVVALRAARGKT